MTPNVERVRGHRCGLLIAFLPGSGRTAAQETETQRSPAAAREAAIQRSLDEVREAVTQRSPDAAPEAATQRAHDAAQGPVPRL